MQHAPCSPTAAPQQPSDCLQQPSDCAAQRQQVAATVIQQAWRSSRSRRRNACSSHQQYHSHGAAAAAKPAAADAGAAVAAGSAASAADAAGGPAAAAGGTTACTPGSSQQGLMPQQQAVQAWHGFAARQAARFVPPPAPCPTGGRRLLTQSVGYRLRLLGITGLRQPLLASVGAAGGNAAACEMQLGVTLYDETTGRFYSTTVFSPPEPLSLLNDGTEEHDDEQQLAFDVFFHSAIADPRCMAVLELILVERQADGMAGLRCSVGWAQLPLCLRKPKHPQASPTAGRQQQAAATAACTAPVKSGTPRYLQFRSVCGEQLPPPPPLGSCAVRFAAEVWPPASDAAVRALLPEDFLVSYTDVIPGLQRFDLHSGQPTTRRNGCALNSLARPLLAPMAAVDIAGVQLVVPQLLHNLLSVLPQLLGTLPPPDLPGLLAVPCEPSCVCYSMRVALHNGRRFVGPWVNTGVLQVQPQLGSLVLRPAAGAAALQLDWLLADELMMLVLELQATPAEGDAVSGRGSSLRSSADSSEGPPSSHATVLVGRALLAPFASVQPDGSGATLAAGAHRLALDSCSSSLSALTTGSSCWGTPGAGATHVLHAGSGAPDGDGAPLLPLNWRALLQDTATRCVPSPSVQLVLQQAAGRPPRLPPSTSAGCHSVVEATAGAAVAAPAPCWLPAASSPALHDVAEQHKTGQLLRDKKSPGPPAIITARAAGTPPHGGLQAQPESTSSAGDGRSPGFSISLMGEETSPAARALCGAAQQLEQAAAGPMEQPPCMPAGLETTAGGTQQQLDRLAATMQRQLDMLAAAVAQLKQERQALRSGIQSSSALEAAVPPAAAPQLAGSADVRRPSRAVLQQLHEAGSMASALVPADAQAQLRAQPAVASTAGATSVPVVVQAPAGCWPTEQLEASVDELLAAEARDPRTACDMVVQLLAYRPNALLQPQRQQPSSLFFSLQFPGHGETVTPPCLLSPAQAPGAAADSETLLLVPPQAALQHGLAQAAAGSAAAGLTLRLPVDGSAPAQGLLPGQPAAQAALAAHLGFSRWLATGQLVIDVWCGASLLQLGSCALPMRALLRQGRQLAETLVEAPVLEHAPGPASSSQPAVLGSLVVRLINVGRLPDNRAARMPSFDGAAGDGGPVRGSRQVSVRAAVFEPRSPVAQQLQGGSPSAAVADSGSCRRAGAAGAADSLAARIISHEQRKAAREVHLQQLLAASPSGSPRMQQQAPNQHWSSAHLSPQHAWRQPGLGAGTPPSKVALWPSAAAAAGPDSPSSCGTPAALPALQRQLLADVAAARGRLKPNFLQEQLRRGFVTECSISAPERPGQALLLEHTLHNPVGRDAVFELRISHPGLLAAVESLQELQELERAVGPAVQTSASADAAAAAVASGASVSSPCAAVDSGTTGSSPAAPQRLAHLMACSAGGSPAGAGVQRVLAARGRVLLAAGECVRLPFCCRPGLAQQQLHTITVDCVPLDLEWPVAVLALHVRLCRPTFDRTLRFEWPQGELCHAQLPLAACTLPGGLSGALLAAAAAEGRLTAAASRSDVHASVAVQPAPAPSDQTSVVVCLRHRCGPWSLQPVKLTVAVYGDALRARPLEVWEVCIYAMQRLDMRAVVGQQATTSLALAAPAHGSSPLVVACYSADPTVLAVSPATLELPAAPANGGASTAALSLTFTPSLPGQPQWLRVHLVNAHTRQLVHALLVVAEAQLPPLHRRIELRVPAGCISQHRLEGLLVNPSGHTGCLTVTTTTPWLLSTAQPAGAAYEVPAGGALALCVAVDTRGLVRPGAAARGLLLVKDARGSLHHDEAVVVDVRACR